MDLLQPEWYPYTYKFDHVQIAPEGLYLPLQRRCPKLLSYPRRHPPVKPLRLGRQGH